MSVDPFDRRQDWLEHTHLAFRRFDLRAYRQFGDAAFLRLYPPTAGIKAGWSAQGG